MINKTPEDANAKSAMSELLNPNNICTNPISSASYFFNVPPVAFAAVLLVNLPSWLKLLLLF